MSGSVDSDRAGVYVLTYTAVDSEGNEAKPVTRTVTVADTTPPVITLLGEATVEVDLNASYTDGATAIDAVDGDHIDGDVELVKQALLILPLRVLTPLPTRQQILQIKCSSVERLGSLV